MDVQQVQATRKPPAKRAPKRQRGSGDDAGKGPVYVRPADGSPIHHALEDVIRRKPFISTIFYLDGKSLSWPMPNGQPPAKAGGLHKAMLFRFFRGQELDNKHSVSSVPKHKRSSASEGARADATLAESIRTGLSPPEPHHVG